MTQGVQRERSKPVKRQWRIIRELASGKPLDPRKFIAEFGVSHQTIYRDFEALMDAGFPIMMSEVVNDEGKRLLRAYMEPDWVTKCPGPETDFTEDTLDIDDVARALDGKKSDKTLAERGMKTRFGLKDLKDRGHPLVAEETHTHVSIKKGREVRHYLCSCGHAIHADEDNCVTGGKRDCPSCTSWVRDISTGVIR